MKKLSSIFLVLAISLTFLAACNTDSPITDPEDEIVDNRFKAEQWLAYDLEFTSASEYQDPVYTVDMDIVFTNSTTGYSFTLPAFWDGGTTWKARYALTELGEWTWTTVCTDETNTGLHGISGEVVCVEYTGDLDIYKHGFLKTELGVRHFMYADGTPFFYLGDTHWTMPLEDLDGIAHSGSYYLDPITQEVADQYGITSMFKHIMDYRAEQGFTVIQSQHLGVWTDDVYGTSWIGGPEGTIFYYGVNDLILAKFQQLDRYFAYIAEKGLVHANAQLAYVMDLLDDYAKGIATDEKIDKLSRYWVARYCAYPVLWTTAQEADNDYYSYEGYTLENNPWKLVLEAVAKYDPYDHPSSAHQEGNSNASAIVNEDSFSILEAHSWYAAQWFTDVENGSNYSWGNLRKYWNNEGSKPVVNYEGHYDHFWGGTMAQRVQGWGSFLNGQFGFGYGSQPIWSLDWAAIGWQNDEHVNDEVDPYSHQLNWLEGLYSDASTQLIYMKNFLRQYEWWNLVPCFNTAFPLDEIYYRSSGDNYVVATIENQLYIGYFYGSGENTVELGTFRKMENADYKVVWMNCATGEYTEPETVTITDGTYKIPAKPTDGDWVISMELITE